MRGFTKVFGFKRKEHFHIPTLFHKAFELVYKNTFKADRVGSKTRGWKKTQGGVVVTGI